MNMTTDWSEPDEHGIAVAGTDPGTKLVVRLSAGNQWMGTIAALARWFAEQGKLGTQPILDEVLIDTLHGLVPARFSVTGEYEALVAWAQGGPGPSTMQMWMFVHVGNPGEGYTPASPPPHLMARYVVPAWPGAVRSVHVGWKDDGAFAAYRYGLPAHMGLR